MAYKSINPNDGKLLKSFEHMSNAELEKSLAQAQTCFDAWKHKSYAERVVKSSSASRTTNWPAWPARS